MSMPQIQLAGKSVGRMGFGLMLLTWNPYKPDEETSIAAIKAAVDAGCTAWSTALFYGNFKPDDPNPSLDNIRLIAAFFKKYPEYKDKVVLVVKGGLTEKFSISIDLDFWRKQLKEAQEILGDKKMDIVSPARIPPDTSPEEVAQAMVTLRDEGYFERVGCSETNAETVARMNKIVPIEVIEIEVSLWSYDKAIQDVVKFSNENKIPIYAYSPLGRGFISRKWKSPEDIPKEAMQQHMPRFQGEAFYHNLKLVDQLDELAEKKKLKTTQLALAWINHLSPYMIPIPGSSNPDRCEENAQAANIELTEEDLKGINETLAKFEPKGGRYADSSLLMK